MVDQKFKAGDRVKLNQEYLSLNEDVPSDSGTVSHYDTIFVGAEVVYVKWDSTSREEWVYERDLDFEVNQLPPKYPTRLKIFGSQLNRAIILLRRYNPGPISNMTELQVQESIIDHALRVYSERDWDIGSSFFSATMGYFLNFWVVKTGDALEVRCEILIDPNILLLNVEVGDLEYSF